MKKYFLHNGTDQQGPFDFEELKNKNVTRETSIWYEGISDWTTAGKLDELKELFTSLPPALKPPKIKDTKHVFVPEKKKSNLWRKISVLTGIIILVVIGISAISHNSESENPEDSYHEKVMTVKEIEESQPVNFLKADGNYNQNFWGNKLKVHGKITNSATVATYKDAIVKVTYYSKTNTDLGSYNYTIYDIFPPNSIKPFELKIENHENANSIGWEVIQATVK